MVHWMQLLVTLLSTILASQLIGQKLDEIWVYACNRYECGNLVSGIVFLSFMIVFYLGCNLG